jgi:hypothetical protein
MDVGANYQFARNWRVYGGYKLIGLSQVAVADNHFPHYIAAADELSAVKSNGSLVLQGAFAGLEARF